MSSPKVLFGFHAVGVRMKTAPKSIIEVYFESTRRDARMRQFIERAKEAAVHNSVSLESRRTAVEDVDSIEVLVRLQAQELVYRSALAVNARVLQPSLMDFLR